LYENVSLVFLYWNPKGFIFIQSWPRYERSREVPVWNSFYSALPIGLFMSFPPPSRMIHMKNKRRRERKDKNTGGGSERHKQIYYPIIPSLHQSHSPKYLIRNFSSSRSGKLRLKMWYIAKRYYSDHAISIHIRSALSSHLQFFVSFGFVVL
jgi:hypothetical protein